MSLHESGVALNTAVKMLNSLSITVKEMGGHFNEFEKTAIERAGASDYKASETQCTWAYRSVVKCGAHSLSGSIMLGYRTVSDFILRQLLFPNTKENLFYAYLQFCLPITEQNSIKQREKKENTKKENTSRALRAFILNSGYM